jgi:hypothetical protein
MNPAATAITIANLRSTFVDPSATALQCAVNFKNLLESSVAG